MNPKFEQRDTALRNKLAQANARPHVLAHNIMDDPLLKRLRKSRAAVTSIAIKSTGLLLNFDCDY